MVALNRLIMTSDNTSKISNQSISRSPSPVASSINRSNNSTPMSSCEKPISLEVYRRVPTPPSPQLSLMSSFNVDFDSVNLENDFQLHLNPPSIPNDIIRESNVVERFMGFFKKKEDDDPKLSNLKSVKKKRSLGCLSFFRRDDTDETVQQPTKSILKSKVNKNYEAEQSKCKCEESLDFEEFMGRFEYTEQQKNSNDEALSMLRMEQVRNYFYHVQ
ncbi:conserved hypothetical protein [Candida dubliniensis CD36]|uniref:Uncharacterized protein n=1 Tax=Candida dubliniensis (strain CD36 / ATCC MYA-646 / CBS 7987 / NCPF 3949 / NRRL Y-17841) TaxID=573826 RepID=B9WF55_CANDC|nr:conserved hypothetical protein [Candida dubliniensis CD36]CAX42511.1 conserved hypothetical protein [Candida dubliniensis CD36]